MEEEVRAITEPQAGSEQDQCAGCRQELKDGQALVALDKQYHIWCFKCTGQSQLSHHMAPASYRNLS